MRREDTSDRPFSEFGGPDARGRPDTFSDALETDMRWRGPVSYSAYQTRRTGPDRQLDLESEAYRRQAVMHGYHANYGLPGLAPAFPQDGSTLVPLPRRFSDELPGPEHGYAPVRRPSDGSYGSAAIMYYQNAPNVSRLQTAFLAEAPSIGRPEFAQSRGPRPPPQHSPRSQDRSPDSVSESVRRFHNQSQSLARPVFVDAFPGQDTRHLENLERANEVAIRREQVQSSAPPSSNSNSITPFVSKLYKLVNEPDYDHLIRWDASGNVFTFATQSTELMQVLSRFYRHSNIHSFVRQLNIYDFVRMSQAEVQIACDKSAPTSEIEFAGFWHPDFFRESSERGMCDLTAIKPKPAKKAGGKRTRRNDATPDVEALDLAGLPTTSPRLQSRSPSSFTPEAGSSGSGTPMTSYFTLPQRSTHNLNIVAHGFADGRTHAPARQPSHSAVFNMYQQQNLMQPSQELYDGTYVDYDTTSYHHNHHYPLPPPPPPPDT